MKKLKFVIAAMVIAVGVVGVFAFGNAEEKEPVKEEVLTTYYAIRIGTSNDFRWTDDASEIQGLVCATLQDASCSVEADTQPANNTNPDPTPDHLIRLIRSPDL